MKGPTLKVTSDFTKQFNDVIARFKYDSVLVGIPETDPTRAPDPETGKRPPINNATLLAINNFGSPANNIPARPVMQLGITAAQDGIAAAFASAAKYALSKGLVALDVYYERAGSIAANSIKKVINSQQGFEGPAESTLRSRLSRGFKGTKALIVTGQMRNAITYVVQKGGL